MLELFYFAAFLIWLYNIWVVFDALRRCEGVLWFCIGSVCLLLFIFFALITLMASLQNFEFMKSIFSVKLGGYYGLDYDMM